MTFPRRFLVALWLLLVLFGFVQLGMRARAQGGPSNVYLPLLSTPLGVEVLSSQLVEVPGVSFYVVGELQNKTSAPVTNVTVSMAFRLYPNGEPATAVGSALLANVAPGQIMPFEIDLAGRRSFEYTLAVAWRDGVDTSVQPVAIVRQELESGFLGSKAAIVEVRNDSASSIRNVRIAVAFLAGSSVVDVAAAAPADVLAPGQAKTYRVTVVNDTTVASATNVRALAQGEPFTPQPLTAQSVIDAFNAAGLGVTNVRTEPRNPNSPLPNSYQERLSFAIPEVAPRGGQVFVCDTKQNCDAIFAYFDALKALAGPYLYQSPDGRVVAQLNSGLTPATAAQFRQVIAALP